jgi:isocitrate/isopropylmalate dehydrogenase
VSTLSQSEVLIVNRSKIHRNMSNKNYKIACIPADGIGPEVIDAGVKVLEALSAASKSFTLDFEHYDWSSETYKKTGKYIPDNGLEDLKKHDAIFFGAVGAPGLSKLLL